MSMKKQTQKSFLSGIGVLILVYLLLAAGMYWIVENDWSITAVKSDSVSQGYLLPAGSEITQRFQASMDGLDEITLIPHFDQAEHTGNVTLSLMDQGSVLWTEDLLIDTWTSDESVRIPVSIAVQHKRQFALMLHGD